MLRVVLAAILLLAPSVAAGDCYDWPLRTDAPAWASGPIRGTASVIDGDTIAINGERIRLHGIDAPETKQSCQLDGQPWNCGQEATFALADKIGKNPIVCERKGKSDRYGRTVAVCLLNGEDLNGWMVSQGWALAYRQYSRDYVPQESGAKEARRGVWASDFVPPWEWRNERRNNREKQ